MREDGLQEQGPEHVTLGGELYFPGVHATQLDKTSTSETLEKPALHQQEELATIEVEWIGQGLHEVAPVVCWKVPGGQSKHDEAPVTATYVPARHSVHRAK